MDKSNRGQAMWRIERRMELDGKQEKGNWKEKVGN